MSQARQFDDRYREDQVLRDGRRVRIRQIRSADKPRLLAAFEQLSERSRRSRFLAPRKRLTPADLAYLTEIDGLDHFALGAAELTADGHEGAGVGIARFTRSPADPAAAEFAIVVLDSWQRLGLARLLLVRLMAAARERGIRSFQGEFLAENTAIRRLLEGLCPDLSIRPAEPGLLGVELPLVRGEGCGGRRATDNR